MVSFNVGLFLLAIPAFLAEASSIRGTPPEDVVQYDQHDRDLASHGYHEWLGQCNGAVCGLWGDPHMVTCDGVGFDCQGLGAFNIMDNQMFKIQAKFVDVGAHEHNLIKGWGLTEGASLTNDLAIEFKQTIDGEKPPIFQFGFGDLSRHDGTFPSEDGCTPYQYYNPTDMAGQGRTWEHSVGKCRERCERTPGCVKFSWWANHGCHLNSEEQTPRPSPLNWARSLSGPVETCGTPPTPAELADDEERFKTGMIGPRCPLLMHQDGKLVDISLKGRWEFYYGDHKSKVQIQNIDNRAIKIQYTLDDGSKAEMHLWVRGHGPGELWSCHFDFWVCLPNSQQAEFMDPENFGGLLGSPDGNTRNDFIDADGNDIGIHNHQNNWHKTLIDYCYDNHCVQPDDSILTPPNGQTFEDIKCEHVDYVPFDPESFTCVLTAEQIYDACKDFAPFYQDACMLECCMGGCDQVPESVDEIEKLKTLSEQEEDIFYDSPKPPAEACVEEDLADTSDTVCPSSTTEVVKLLSTTGTEPLPDKDIFYGIKMDSGGDEVGRTVKFKINNPWDSSADIYVKYGQSVFGHAFMDPKCDPFVGTKSGCETDAVEIEVACHDYESIAPFALVQVFFASTSIEGTTDIDECCLEGNEDHVDKGIVMYSFEIQCACPDANAATTR